MTDTDEAQRVTAGLTLLQRRAITAPQPTVDGRVLTDCDIELPTGLTAYYSARMCRLTPLGLAVRRILTEQPDTTGEIA